MSRHGGGPLPIPARRIEAWRPVRLDATWSAMEMFELRVVDPASLETVRRDLSAKLRALLPAARIREIGSTAVEGAIGKGDLDFLVSVTRTGFADARDRLDASFARNAAQLSNEEFQGYRVAAELDAAIQLTVDGSRLNTFERFLDILRSDREALQAYNELKLAWAGRPMSDYRAHKAEFIERLLRRL